MARPDLPNGLALWVILKHNANGFGREAAGLLSGSPVFGTGSSEAVAAAAAGGSLRMRNPNSRDSTHLQRKGTRAAAAAAAARRQRDQGHGRHSKEEKWADASWNIRSSKRPNAARNSDDSTAVVNHHHYNESDQGFDVGGPGLDEAGSSMMSEEGEDLWLDGEFDLIGEDLTVVQRAEPYVAEMEEAVREISLNRIRSVSQAAETLQIALRHPDEFVRALFEEGATLARLLQNSVTNMSIDFLPKGMKDALADTEILNTHEVPSPRKFHEDDGRSAGHANHHDEPAVFRQTAGALGTHSQGSDVRNAQPYFFPHQEDDFSLDEWASVREFNDGDTQSRYGHTGQNGHADDERVRYIAIYRYDAGHSDELSVARDEVLYFYGAQPGESLDEWVQVENSFGDIGAVPVAVLKKVEVEGLVPKAAVQQGPGFEPVTRAPQELQQAAAETRVRAVEDDEAKKALKLKKKKQTSTDKKKKQLQQAELDGSESKHNTPAQAIGTSTSPAAATSGAPQTRLNSPGLSPAKQNVASIKTRRRVFLETQVRLKVLYNVRAGDSTLKNCITAVRGDDLIGIAKDGEWWQCAHVGDEEALKAGPLAATFIPDSYVQVNIVSVEREVVEATGVDAEADKVLLVDLEEQSEYQARLKKQAEDLANKTAQLEQIQSLARRQEERAEKAERERLRVAAEKEQLNASLQEREEARSQEARSLEEQQSQLQRQKDMLEQERRRVKEERDALEEARRTLAATQREQRDRAAELRAQANAQSQRDVNSSLTAAAVPQSTPATQQRRSQSPASQAVDESSVKKPTYRSPLLSGLPNSEHDKQQQDSVEQDLNSRSNRVTSEIEDSLVSLLGLPEGSHLVDVHLSPGSMGCIVAEDVVNGVNVVVIDELRPTAQPGLQQGDIIACVNGASTVGRDTDFFANLVKTAGPRCLSLLRRGSGAGTVPSREHSPGSTFEVTVPQGSIGVIFRGVGGDIVVEGFTQASPVRKGGEVWVGDKLIAVCGEDVRSRGLSYAIQKIVATQHMGGRTLLLERGSGSGTSAAELSSAAGLSGQSVDNNNNERTEHTWNLIEELPTRQIRLRLQAFEGKDQSQVSVEAKQTASSSCHGGRSQNLYVVRIFACLGLGLNLQGIADVDIHRVYNQIIEETASRPDVGKPRPFVPNRLTKPIPADDESVPFLPDIFDFVSRYIEKLPPNQPLQVRYTPLLTF